MFHPKKSPPDANRREGIFFIHANQIYLRSKI